MSGHSKWSTIKHKKAKEDSKRSKIFTKVAKAIEMAARWWADPKLNASLETALEKAKYNSLPKDVIERAIKKWSWQTNWENLEEIFYEWYWPEWTAMYIKCVTSNKNRTYSNVKSIFHKMWCNLWEAWSVSWQFHDRWVFYINWTYNIQNIKWKDVKVIEKINVDNFEEKILETDVEDYILEEDIAKIITMKENFSKVKDFLEQNKYNIENADIEYIPENFIDLNDESWSKLEKLIDTLEEDDDVGSIYHNAN